MVDFINRLRRGGTRLKEKAAAFQKRRQARQKVRAEFIEAQNLARDERMEKRAAEIIKKQNRITDVRKAQLARARAEAGILKARASVKRSQRQIIGPIGVRGVQLNLGGPLVSSKVVKKKKGGPTPGLGRFRVL